MNKFSRFYLVHVHQNYTRLKISTRSTHPYPPSIHRQNTQTFQMQSYFHKTEGIRPIYITLIKYSAPVICGYPLYSKSKRHLEIVFALVILDMN